MNQEAIVSAVPGARDLIDWFGYWPSFHDAEVLGLSLSRSEGSSVRIHAFEMTNELNLRGQYVCVKHATILFLLHGLKALDLEGFNQQNVLSGLSIDMVDSGYKLNLAGCYGIEGSLTCEGLHIALEPGVPLGSAYAEPE